MATLCLLQFNNYYNRIVRRFNTLEEYIGKTETDDEYTGGTVFTMFTNVNFNPNDNMNTTQIVNWNDDYNPDYCLILDANNKILSRWFIMEAVRTRAGQYKMTLRRDIVADYYELILQAPCFIEKGMVTTPNSPLLYNKEDITFNQIKKNEILLKDQTGVPWIVAYIARSYEGEGLDPTSTVTTNVSTTENEPTGNVINFEDLPNSVQQAFLLGQQYEDACVFLNGEDSLNLDIFVTTKWTSYFPKGRWFYIQTDGINRTPQSMADRTYYDPEKSAYDRAWLVPPYNVTKTSDLNDLKIDLNWGFDANIAMNTARRYKKEHFSELVIQDYVDYNGKYVKKDGNIYVLTFTKGKELSVHENVFVKDDEIFGPFFKDGLRRLQRYPYEWKTSVHGKQKSGEVTAKFTPYKIELKDYISKNVSTTIVNEHRNKLVDAPYDMICAPYGKIKVNNVEVGSEDSALAVAQIIKETFGNYVYDIQILPYCPVRNWFDGNNLVTTYRLIEHYDYEYIKISNSTQIDSIILYPYKSEDNFNIYVNNDDLIYETQPLERKIKSECQMVRFNSPNYNGSYEINAQKNNGISLINIDINFKPYTPYIHVCPVFGGIYGLYRNDFADARGLICGGDFSISTCESQWAEYQIQNKNYENIFNRQIQNMDVNNSISQTQAKWSVATGAIGGAAAGAVGGSQIGGPVGAGVGAGVGALASIAGGIADYKLLEKSQAEQKSYVTDIHNYNLQNIQALPYTLTKVSAYNKNNKLFPFIEIYDCTDEEKEIFRNKINYESMTVNAIGKIVDYLGNDLTFIKGQLIRLEGLNEDNHLAEQIYIEISKGVYI